MKVSLDIKLKYPYASKRDTVYNLTYTNDSEARCTPCVRRALLYGIQVQTWVIQRSHHHHFSQAATASHLPLLVLRSHGQLPTTACPQEPWPAAYHCSPKEPRPAAYHCFSPGATASCLPLLLPRSHGQLPTIASPTCI